MGIIVTKYSVDDRVFLAMTRIEKRQHPCPDCLGSRKWEATSPAGEKCEFACPRCGGQFRSNQDLSLDYYIHAPEVRSLTIGSVRTDSHGDRPVSYMAHETGVGSGNVWDENDLYPTFGEAYLAAEILARHRTSTNDTMVKTYDRTLDLSDFQLHNAVKRGAEQAKSSFDHRVAQLFTDLDEAENMEDVRKAIAEWRGEG